MLFALVLFALVVVAGTLHRTGLAGVFALSFLSVLWLLGNKGVEHETLVTLSVGHGVTALDAAGIAGLVLVLAQLTRVVWRGVRNGDPRARKDGADGSSRGETGRSSSGETARDDAGDPRRRAPGGQSAESS